MPGYDEMLAFNKPFVLGEIGPTTTNGLFDYMRWYLSLKYCRHIVASMLSFKDICHRIEISQSGLLLSVVPGMAAYSK